METLLGRSLSGFDVLVKSFPPGHRCQWGEQVPGRLCVFLDGSLHEVEDGRTYASPDVVYKPPEDRPELRFGDAGARTLTIELRADGVETLRAGGFDVEVPFSVRSDACRSLAERTRAELANTDDMTPLLLEGFVLELFARTHRSRARGTAPPWIARVRERIDHDYARPLTLRDYARAEDVHPVRLAAAFRTHYRTSVGELVRSLRVQHAARELRRTANPVAEIALEAGFCDQSHLTRVFKKATGLTPSRFRRSVKHVQTAFDRSRLVVV